jgi:hypothetical protein
MEVNSHLHDTAALSRKNALLIKQESGWTPGPVLTLKYKKSLAAAEIEPHTVQSLAPSVLLDPKVVGKNQ